VYRRMDVPPYVQMDVWNEHPYEMPKRRKEKERKEKTPPKKRVSSDGPQAGSRRVPKDPDEDPEGARRQKKTTL
jgi:hypothetical protein